MPRTNDWPSKWWFCTPFLALNLYLFIGLFGPLFFPASGHPGGRAVVNFLIERVFVPMYLPLRLLVDRFVEPLGEALHFSTHVGEDLALWLGLLVASCELAAVVLGLVCYGGAWLVYAVTPAEGSEGKQGDGSR